MDSRSIKSLVGRFQRLKERVGYGAEMLPLKWSLGDNDDAEAKAKAVLRRKLGDGWLGKTRDLVLEFLSRRKVLLVASVLQATQGDVRDPIVYYEKGIRFLLQRLCFIVKREKSKHNYVVLDTPPRDKATKAYQVYEAAYWGGFIFGNRALDPLMLNSADCLYCSSSRYSPLLQLADFWAGFLGPWAKKCLDQPNSLPHYEQLMRSLLPKVYGRGFDKFGYGLVIVPRAGTLRGRAYRSFLRIIEAA